MIDPGRPTRVRWRILGLLLLYAALCHFNRIGMSVAGAERIMKDYAISGTVMGLVYSSYLLIYTLFMTPGGWFIDRFGTRTSLMVVGFGSAIFAALTGLAGFVATSGVMILALLFPVRALMGLVNVPIHPSAAHSVSRWIPAPRRTLANGMVTATAVAGIALTYPVFGMLMDRFGWPLTFILSACVTGAVALVWAAVGATRPAEHRSVNEAEKRLIGEEAAASNVEAGEGVPLWRNRSLLLLTLSFAAVGYFQYLFFYWHQYYLTEVVKLEIPVSRGCTTLVTLGMAAGMVIGGWLADRCIVRFGRRRGRALVAVSGMIGSALFLGLGLLRREPAWVISCFTLAMASAGACEGAFWTTAIDLGGARGGTAAAILNTGGNAGGMLAPVVTPLFSSYFGWLGGFGLACVFCLLGALLWRWIRPPQPPSLAPGHEVLRTP